MIIMIILMIIIKRESNSKLHRLQHWVLFRKDVLIWVSLRNIQRNNNSKLLLRRCLHKIIIFSLPLRLFPKSNRVLRPSHKANGNHKVKTRPLHLLESIHDFQRR
jgi:hypothetical protein